MNKTTINVSDLVKVVSTNELGCVLEKPLRNTFQSLYIVSFGDNSDSFIALLWEDEIELVISSQKDPNDIG